MANVTVKSLKICHVNAQSLLAHFTDFKEHFAVKDYHIICISETWLNPSLNSDVVALPGYCFYRKDRVQKTGGGVGVYVRSNIPATVICCSSDIFNNKAEFIFF